MLRRQISAYLWLRLISVYHFVVLVLLEIVHCWRSFADEHLMLLLLPDREEIFLRWSQAITAFYLFPQIPTTDLLFLLKTGNLNIDDIG